MYEDIYKGLTEEERLRMIKADIPKFEVVGEAGLTEEEMQRGREALLLLIKETDKGNQHEV